MKRSTFLTLYTEIDSAVARELRHAAREGMTPSCRRGCAACCHHRVLATALEADAIVAFVDRTGGRPGVESLAKRSADAMVATGDPPARAEDTRPSPRTAAGECTVYEWRPGMCRIYWVLNDPQVCERGGTLSIMEMPRAGAIFLDGLADAMGGPAHGRPLGGVRRLQPAAACRRDIAPGGGTMIGRGQFDEICTQIRKETGAYGVILLIDDGKRTSFEVQVPAAMLTGLPRVLRHMAGMVENGEAEAAGAVLGGFVSIHEMDPDLPRPEVIVRIGAPSVYEPICTRIRREAAARAAMVLVLGGERGTGMCVQHDPLAPLNLAAVFRLMAKTIAADMARHGLQEPEEN